MYCVKKGKLHLSYLLDDGLLIRKRFGYQAKSGHIYNSLPVFCLSKKEFIRKLPV